jgi:hypothetical protein
MRVVLARPGAFGQIRGNRSDMKKVPRDVQVTSPMGRRSSRLAVKDPLLSEK